MPIRLHLTNDGEGYLKDDVKNALRDLQKSIDTFKKKNTTLTEEYTSLLSDLEDFSSKYANLEAQHKALLNRLKTNSDKVEKVKTNDVDRTEEFEELTDENNQLKNEIDIWRDKYRGEVKTLKGVIKSLKTEVSSLVSELNQIEINEDDTIGNLKLSISKLKRSVKNEESRNAELKNEIVTLENTIKEIRNKTSNNHNDNDNSDENENSEKSSDLTNINSTLKQDLDLALDQLVEERKKVAELKRQVKEEEDKNKHLTKENKEANNISSNLAAQLNAKESLEKDDIQLLFHDIIESLSTFFNSKELIENFKSSKSKLYSEKKLEPLLENVQMTINRIIDNHRKELVLSLGSVADDQNDIHKLTTILNKSTYNLRDKRYSSLTKAIKDLILFSLTHFQETNINESAVREIEKKFGSLKMDSRNLEDALNNLKEEKENIIKENNYLKTEIKKIERKNSLNRSNAEKRRLENLYENFSNLSDISSRTRLEMITLLNIVKSSAEELETTSRHIEEKIQQSEEKATFVEKEVKKHKEALEKASSEK